MKEVSITICCLIYIVARALAMEHSSSYCCSEGAEISVNDDGSKQCLDMSTNATTNIALLCFDNMTYALANNPDFPLKFDDEGTLNIMVNEFSELLSFERNKFCIGQQTESGTLILVCADAEEEVISQDFLVYLMALSSVFLALTALVYLALPELRDLQGKSLISLCISLAIYYIFMCMIKGMAYENMTWCAITGFLAYYFMISSFFWMNAIATQIMVNLKRSTVNSCGWREFTWYSLYGWGVSAILTIILLIVNYYPGTHQKPGIGYILCWFHDLERIWIYLYSVIAIVMAANVIIFVYTSTILWNSKFSSNHLRTLRNKFLIMLRLFVIMGLSWIFEMVTSLTPVHIVGVILDIFNCLQGILIFVMLVVFRRRVIRALHRKKALCCLNGCAENYLALPFDEVNKLNYFQ